MANGVVGGTVMKLLREEMAGMVHHIMENDPDPVMTGIVLNTSSVKTSSNLGANLSKSKTSEFSALHPLVFGRAGAIKYSSLAGVDLTANSPPRLALDNAYPSATLTAQTESELLEIPLKWMQGNLTIHRHQLLALENGNPVEDFVARWLKGPIDSIHQQMTTDFFGSGTGQLGVISASSAAMTNVGDSTNLTVTGNVRPFWRGQLVEIFDTGTGLNNGLYMVSRVWSHPQTKITVTCVTAPSSAFTAAAGDVLHLYGAYTGTLGMSGLGNFILDGSSPSADINLHGLNVYTHSGTVYNYPELFSLVDAPGTNRWPTPSVFELNMDKISDRGFDPPNRWITTRGVRSQFTLTEGLYKTYQTGLNNPSQAGANGGWTGDMRISNEKGDAEFVISAFCPKNTAYGIRTDAFVRYAPKGVDAVQFLYQHPMVGGNTFNVARAASTASPVPVFEAPFDFWVEMGCVTPQVLVKMGNLYELGDVTT